MMKNLLPVTTLIFLAFSGVWFGNRIGTQKPKSQTGTKTVSSSKESRHSTRPITVPKDLAGVMQGLRESKSAETKYALLLQLNQIPVSQIAEAFADLAREDPNKDRLDNRELRRLLHILIDRNPREAVRLCRKHFTGLKRSHSYFNIVDAWGRADPESALRFIVGLDEKENDIHVLNATTSFLSEWARRDPKRALASWLALPDPKLANPEAATYGAECLASSAARTPELRFDALDMLLAEPNTDARTSAIAGVLSTWARTSSLSEAGTWLESQNLGKEEKSRIAAITATTAALQGDGQAGNWLTEKLHGDKHDQANQLAEFTENWARGRPNDCARWLSTLERSHENDWAIRGFLRQVGHSDPESGFLWTRRISDPNLRKKTAKELWNQWRRHAPVSAREFVSHLDSDENRWLVRSQRSNPQ